MIGARLKIARAASGLSLRELEAKIGKRVTAQMIGKYERDEAMPSSDVLIVLAQALAVTEEFLLSDGALVLDGVEFRKKAVASSKEQAHLEGQTLHLLSRYLAVEAVLGLPSIEWDKPREAPYPIHSVADAENAANALRVHWGLGVDPIPNLVELFEERGIKVLSVPLSDISGMAAKVRRSHGEPVPVVVVSRNDWSERKRFTLAHELGHMVMDMAALDSDKDAERAAHRFAGAFLMPAGALWREIGKRRSSISFGEFLSLKRLFGASFQAIAFRCRDLGLINAHMFQRLFQEFGKLGWRSPPFKEPGAIAPTAEQPQRLERLTYRALAEDVIGEARAAEILGLSIRELNARMDARSSE